MLVSLFLDVLDPWLRLNSCKRKFEECNLTVLAQDYNTSEGEFLAWTNRVNVGPDISSSAIAEEHLK